MIRNKIYNGDKAERLLVASLKFQVLSLLTVICICFSIPAQSSDKLTNPEIALIAAYESAQASALKQAQEEFGGRGPALAHYFLNHQSGASNTAFFFLFKAVGDTETAEILIHALPNPPTPVDSVLARHSGEIEMAVEELLGNDKVRLDPAILKALEEALAKARTLAWGNFPATIIISLMGSLKTPDAAQALEKLAQDPDPAIRMAAVEALGRTGLASVEKALEQAMSEDRDPDVRAAAADAFKGTANEDTVSSLLTSLEKEAEPHVIDSILQSLTSLRAVPDNPDACLKLAQRAWDTTVAEPFFNCWWKKSSREDLTGQAVSGTWAVRALALKALTESLRPGGPFLLAQKEDGPPSSFDDLTRTKLLESAVLILSQTISGAPRSESISHETAYITKEAFWAITGYDMEIALAYADRIMPLNGRYDYIGRFGASAYLASKDAAAYSALRRPGQLLLAVALVLACAVFFGLGKARKLGTGLVAGIFLWIAVMLFENGIDIFPPLPLGFLTIPALSFITAGLVAGAVSLMKVQGWVKLIIAPLAAGFAALIICVYSRAQKLYPIGSEGWELYFDPLGCALLATPTAFFITLGLLWWKPKGSVQA